MTASGNIVVRVPLRICLAGGGTDLPENYRLRGGYVVSATIDKYLTISIRRTPGMRIRKDAIHPYATAAGWTDQELIQISSDVPPGSGLGGSGALMVGLLKARWPELGRHDLATTAFTIERYSLAQAVGYQDATVAAYGGVVSMTISRNGDMEAHRMPQFTQLSDRLAMFATGIQRDARNVLSRQAAAISQDPGLMQEIHGIGVSIISDLHSTGGSRLGDLMHRHWQAKRRSCSATTTHQIDEWYALALRSGASGGKCIGAGGGGHMLFVVEPSEREQLVRSMTAAGLTETPFQFVDHGAEIIS